MLCIMSNFDRDPSVREVIERRFADGYIPGYDDDGFKVAGMVSGGGMRIAVGAGMTAELAHSERLGVFDMLGGHSGGGLVMAGIMTGDVEKTRKVFTEALPASDFVSPIRAARGKGPLVSIDTLARILADELPLDVHSLARQKQKFLAVTTRMDDLSPQTISNRTVGPDEMLDRLMHSVHLPLVAGQPPETELDGERFTEVDGGVGNYLTTYDFAVANGATHVLVMDSAPQKPWSVDTAGALVMGKWFERNGTPDGTNRIVRFATAQARRIRELHASPPAHRDVIYPPPGRLPGGLTTKVATLQAGYVAGQRACSEWLADVPPDTFHAHRQPSRAITYGRHMLNGFANALVS